MLAWLVAAVAFADPAAQISAMFPGSAITEVGGAAAISPIKRKGEVGYVLVSDISTVPVGKRSLIAFGLQTTEADTVSRATEGEWTRVLAVILVEADGTFVAKPEGFPLEERVDLGCMGDFCDFGPRGALEAVEGSDRFAILRWHGGAGESMGAIRPLLVEGDAIRAFEDVADGSAGGLTGCAWTQQFQGFKESKGVLRAVRMRSCDTGPDCEQICSEQGYPQEATLSPVTLAP